MFAGGTFFVPHSLIRARKKFSVGRDSGVTMPASALYSLFI
jgi:hypothetical protein